MRVLSARATRVALVRESLALRGALLRYLRDGPTAPAFGRMRGASPDAWAFLLRLESCALPLTARLRRDGALDAIGEPALERLLGAESTELQRVLAARHLIRELDAVAHQTGVRLTLLKGAAVVADGAHPPLDLGDVDVLVVPHAAPTVWQTLVERGWSPRERGVTPDDVLGPRLHYAPLRSERHLLPLELHVSFGYGPRGSEGERLDRVPIDGYRSLDRFEGPGALAATLRHSVGAHPHRRGHLRDPFLLAGLIEVLRADSVRQVHGDFEGDELEVEALAMLAQARALARRTGPIDDSPALRPFVSWKYATAARTTTLFAVRASGWISMTHVPLERVAVRRSAYRRLLSSAGERIPAESSIGTGSLLGSHFARWLGLPRLVRAAYRASLVTLLIAVGGALCRHVRQLDVGVD